MTELRRLQAPECDGAGCTGDPFEGPAAGRARSGKRSRDLERQGLDIDAADQRDTLRQSRRVQVVRRSTGEVVSEHESAKQAARTLGIPLGSIWRFIRKQQVKDGLFVRAAAPSTLCGGDVQGGNKDREWNPTGVNEVAADCSPLGVDLPRSTNNSPADTGDGSHALACDALSEEDDCNVLHAWDQWTRTLSPGLMQSQAICMAFDERTCQMVVPTPLCKTYHGYVESVGELSCRCWFDDHFEMEVPQALVRQCLVPPDPAHVTMDEGYLTESAALVVDTCTRVWGEGVMPPCIRDPQDVKTGTSVFLVFNSKTIYTGTQEPSIEKQEAGVDVPNPQMWSTTPRLLKWSFLSLTGPLALRAQQCVRTAIPAWRDAT